MSTFNSYVVLDHCNREKDHQFSHLYMRKEKIENAFIYTHIYVLNNNKILTNYITVYCMVVKQASTPISNQIIRFRM
jgi:hypothetical protein